MNITKEDLEIFESTFNKMKAMLEAEQDKPKATKAPDHEWPQLGDEYFLIDNNPEVYCDYWKNNPLDITRKKACNMFRTKEEAEAKAVYMLANAKKIDAAFKINQIIDEINGDWVADWSDVNQSKSELIYSQYELRISNSSNCVRRTNPLISPIDPSKWEQVKEALEARPELISALYGLGE